MAKHLNGRTVIWSARMTTQKKEEMDEILEDGGCTYRTLLDSLSDLLKSGVLLVNERGLFIANLDKNEMVERVEETHGKLYRDLDTAHSEAALMEFQVKDLRKRLTAQGREVDRLKRDIAKGTAPKEISGRLLLEMKSISSDAKISIEDMLDDLVMKIDNGTIGVNAGGLTLQTVDACPFNWQKLVSACDTMSVDYDEVVDKCIEDLYKG